MNQSDLLREIGDRLSAKRREAGYTQEKLAELADLTSQTISYAEQGRKAMRIDTIIRLCEVLGMSADYLLMGKQHMDYSKYAKSINALTGEQQIYIKLIMDACLGLCGTAETE